MSHFNISGIASESLMIFLNIFEHLAEIEAFKVHSHSILNSVVRKSRRFFAGYKGLVCRLRQ